MSAKWVVAVLGQTGQTPPDGGAPLTYAAYTTQPHASADVTKTAALPDSEHPGGTLAPRSGSEQGTYAYVFGTKLPPGFDATKTHTVGVWATRVFAGSTYVVNSLYDFVPNGGAVAATRDVVTTQACNQCHNPLGYHEGGTQRRDVRLCVLCHPTPAVDVTNGNAL